MLKEAKYTYRFDVLEAFGRLFGPRRPNLGHCVAIMSRATLEDNEEGDQGTTIANGRWQVNVSISLHNPTKHSMVEVAKWVAELSKTSCSSSPFLLRFGRYSSRGGTQFCSQGSKVVTVRSKIHSCIPTSVNVVCHAVLRTSSSSVNAFLEYL